MIWILLLLAIAAFAAFRLLNRVKVDHLPESFVVFVVETTGPDPERHEIIEIGATRVGRDSVVHESFRALTRTSAIIPRRVTELTGITQSIIDSEGKPLPEVIAAFNEFIGDLPLVAFNADLGLAFLGNAAKQSGVSFTHKVVCARKMANRAWPERKGSGLSDLAKSENPAKNEKSIGEATHRVLEDCRRVLAVYLAAASRLGTAD